VTRSPSADVTLAELTEDPWPVLARLRAHAPVCWVPALDGWLVTTRAAVAEVLDDAATYTVDDPRFTTAAVVGPSMLSLDGPEHARHRRPFAAAFRPAALAAGPADAVRRLAADLVEGLRGNGSAELRTTLAGPLAAGTMAGLLELDADPSTLLQWYIEISASVAALSAGESATAAGARAAALLAQRVEAACVEEGADGLLARAVRPPAALAPAEVASNAAVLLFGGIETVEGMIANALLHVLGLPDPGALAGHPGRLRGAVEESLRLEPAAARVDRYTTRDTVLAGIRLPAGDLVVASLGAAGRDPAVFADPDRFDPDRPGAAQHLAFARGPHSCVAAGLARLQAQAAIEAVLALPGVRLDVAASTPPRGLVFRKPERVVATWPA
jgi:hypothetical protein